MREWTRERFGESAAWVAKAYELLNKVGRKLVFIPFVDRLAQLEDRRFEMQGWRDLDRLIPNGKIKSDLMKLADFSEWSPSFSEGIYLFDETLRNTPVDEEHLSLWLERFDATELTQQALDLAEKAFQNGPGDPNRSHTKRGAKAAHYLAQCWKNYFGAYFHVRVGGEKYMQKAFNMFCFRRNWTFPRIALV